MHIFEKLIASSNTSPKPSENEGNTNKSIESKNIFLF